MGETIEVIFSQFYLLSIWRNEAGDSEADGFWSLDLVKLPEPTGLLAGMEDGLSGDREKIGATLCTNDWSEVMQHITDLATVYSKYKRI